MSEQTGKLACTLWSFAIGGLAGALAAVMFALVGGIGWNGAVFIGIVLALGLGAFLATVLCRPLPTMAEVQARAPMHAPSVAAVAPPASVHVVAPVAVTSPAAVAPAETPAPAAMPIAAPAAVPAVAAKPVMLTEARNGRADDLKLIKGVGPKLEQMLHRMGVFHFDQIAGWSADEVAWVDDNLEGFKGRVSRDGWVAQARVLADGGTV